MAKTVTTYADALQVVQDLATQNQIDERDIAFGDAGLADQARLQDAALTTVQAYLDRGGADGLPLPPSPIPHHPRELVAFEGEPDPSSLADALRVVLDMGRNNVLSDDGPDMADEVARQERAVALVEDLVVGHGAEVVQLPGPGPA